jgi:hypothetical protein
MSLSPLPLPRGLALSLATAAPAAIGALLLTIARDPAPIAVVPAIAVGVVAATSPALYILRTATAGGGPAPTLAATLRALTVALGAFGVALAGLLLPTAFLALTSRSAPTTLAVTTAALLAAALLGLRRLHAELTTPARHGGTVVFLVWAGATLGIAGRLWLELAREVLA